MYMYAHCDADGVVRGYLVTNIAAPGDNFIQVGPATKVNIVDWLDVKKWDGAKWVNHSDQAKVLTKYEFMCRFTQPELVSILTAIKTDPEVEAYWQMAQAAQEIDLTDPNTDFGLKLLTAKELIKATRPDEILGKAVQQPSEEPPADEGPKGTGEPVPLEGDQSIMNNKVSD